MNFSRLAIRMKHLFLISIFILMLETGLFLAYNFLYLRMNISPKVALAAHNLQVDITVFSANLCLLLMIWIAFILYYRYSLPKEILNLIVGAENERPSDKTIQKLQQEIKNYYEQKNIMITALAHDIKTPLTEAILHLALLDDQTQTAPILKKLDDVNQIINSSLEYAKKPERIRQARVDLISLIESLVEEYSIKGFPIKFRTEVMRFTTDIELQLFKRMITNIIENARKYASACSVTLNLHKKHWLEIIFEDDGPGVPEKYLHLLSIPYFRVDPSRSSETGGTGLGLAIVKKICELHNAKVEFLNCPGGGFMVRILVEKNIVRRRKE